MNHLPPAPREPGGQTVGEAEQQQGAPAHPQQEPESGALREAMQQVSDDRVDAEIGRARRVAEQQTEARVRSGTDDDQLVQRQREEGRRDLGLARRAEEGDPDAREYFRARSALQQDAKERAGRRRDMTPEQIEQDAREVQDMLAEVESLRQRATGEGESPEDHACKLEAIGERAGNLERYQEFTELHAAAQCIRYLGAKVEVLGKENDAAEAENEALRGALASLQAWVTDGGFEDTHEGVAEICGQARAALAKAYGEHHE